MRQSGSKSTRSHPLHCSFEGMQFANRNAPAEQDITIAVPARARARRPKGDYDEPRPPTAAALRRSCICQSTHAQSMLNEMQLAGSMAPALHTYSNQHAACEYSYDVCSRQAQKAPALQLDLAVNSITGQAHRLRFCLMSGQARRPQTLCVGRLGGPDNVVHSADQMAPKRWHCRLTDKRKRKMGT